MHAHSCKYRLDLRNSCTRVPAIRSSPAQRQALLHVCVHIASVSPAICVSGCGYVPGGRWTALSHFSTGGIHHRRQRPSAKGAPHDQKVTVGADSSHVCGHVHASEIGCASTCACIIQGLWVCTYGYAYACMCMFVFCVRIFSAHKVTVHTCVAMCMRACIWVCKYVCKHHTCGNMGMHMHACFFWRAHTFVFVWGGGRRMRNLLHHGSSG